MMTAEYHIPVMLKEVIDGLDLHPAGTYVDVTFGGGGHAAAILDALGPEGRLIAFDRDEQAKENCPDDDRLTFIGQDFMFLKNHLRYLNILPVNGILADLGVSSHQFDTAERGFSYRFDAPLDMRMEQSIELTAADVLNLYNAETLQKLLSDYGEVPNARTLAEGIIKQRELQPFSSVADLKELADVYMPKKLKRMKYLSMVFQALRIEVNQEIVALKRLLTQATECLATEGRLVVISYHSIEDRQVKNFFRSGNFEGKLEKDFYGNTIKPMQEINKKPIVPTTDEIEMNPRARSAKLRIAKKINSGK